MSTTRGKYWSTDEGLPAPLGATWIADENSYNFAIYSKYADEVTVLLYAADECTVPVLVYRFDPLRNKTGRVWHARIAAGITHKAKYYSYSINGPISSGARFERHAFDPNKVLLDPYAKSVFFPPDFSRAAAIGRGSNQGRAPLGVLPSQDESAIFDWGSDIRPRHDGDLILYELHVRGFTQNENSGVSAQRNGTFLGLIDKIPYLLDLGVTAVELMPVFQFDASEPNYWGYMPLSFFSPHGGYTANEADSDCRTQFKTMVKALHEAHIEVILDVVYNHTGEGNEHGPVFGLKGIDNSSYYMASEDPTHPYADFTGTGNTLHCANRAVRQLIVDSLSYWAREMHVDGFRFDLASVFSRNRDGSINLNDPPIFGDIAGNPHLRDLRLIAEPWEGNMEFQNYQLGTNSSDHWNTSTAHALQRNFPGAGWRQWNDKFRTTVRRFGKGDTGYVADLMTRLYGSADVFPDSLRESYRPWQSLNYVNSHDGFTLYDLVSYNSADSWNCGAKDGEGVPDHVSFLRRQQIKMFCCLLLLANGTPMFRAGDEFCQTQQGAENVYNIDSEQSWLDWSRLTGSGAVFSFFKKMIAFRKSHASLGRSTFWRDDVSWYGIGPSADLSYESRSLAYCLRGGSEEDDDTYVLINASAQPLDFILQEERTGGWFRVIDTSLDSPEDIILEHESRVRCTSQCYCLNAHSIAVFLSLNCLVKANQINSQQPESYRSIQGHVAEIHGPERQIP